MTGSGPILVVDDEEDLRDLLVVNLRREGFQTAVRPSRRSPSSDRPRSCSI
jgi:DNA-binding response OmpR family regulator